MKQLNVEFGKAWDKKLKSVELFIKVFRQALKEGEKDYSKGYVKNSNDVLDFLTYVITHVTEKIKPTTDSKKESKGVAKAKNGGSSKAVGKHTSLQCKKGGKSLKKGPKN